MRRRSRAGGEPSKTRRRKTTTPKRGNAPKSVRPRISVARGRETEVVLLTRERDEALEQQTATAEVLRVISASHGDLQPVFATMLQNVVRICDARYGSVYRCEGDALRLMAMDNAPPALVKLSRHSPFRPSSKHYFGRMIATKAIVHVADIKAEQGYVERRPEYVAAAEAGGVRTYLLVPILRDNELIGA
jgi:two-component system, NtrC family, sensor kinase